MTTYFIGIDIGASFIKSAALNLEGRTLEGRHAVPAPAFMSSALPKRHVDATEVVRLVRKEIDRYASEKPRGIVITGQMGGFMLLEEYKTVPPYISWQDQRCHETMPAGLFPSGHRTYFETLRKILTPEDVADLGELIPCTPIANLHWMKYHGYLPDGAMPISLPDYVAWTLGGPAVGIRPKTDCTLAAAHGLYSLSRGNWHSEVIRRLGLEKLEFPTVVLQGSIVGHLRGIPIYTPVGDHQCSLAGAGLREGEVSINIGTGSQVSTIVDEPGFPEIRQSRPYFGGKSLACITHIPAGRALNGILRLVREMAGISEESAWEYVLEHVSGRKKNDLRWNLNFWPSNRDTEGVYGGGSLVGIMEETLDIGSLFSASFHSMADTYKACADCLSGAYWHAPAAVRLSGGLAHRLEPLRAAIGDRFGCSPTLSEDPDESLTGLLACALSWTGRRPSVQAAAESLRRDS